MPVDPGVRDLRALELFLSAVELGSLSRVAGRYGTSQPAVSFRIITLERRLGVALLHREPSGVRPTEAGRAVATWAAKTVAAAYALLDGAAALSRNGGEALHVGASLTVAEHLVPGWLARLHTAHPEVTLELTVENSERVADHVRSGTLVLGFVEGPKAPRGLCTEVVATDRLVIVVSGQSSWWPGRDVVEAEELASTPLVMGEPGCGIRATLEERLGERRVTLAHPAAILSAPTLVRAAVAADVGPGVLSMLDAAHDLATGTLREVQVRGVDLTRDLRTTWLRGAPPPALGWLLRTDA
jgi:DNA-binding transcriptional LysR family regulator